MKTKRRILSWILTVCMILQLCPANVAAAELVDGQISFGLSISIAEGTDAPDNYAVDYNVVDADGQNVDGPAYAGIVSGNDGMKTITLTDLEEDYQIKFNVRGAGLGIRLSGADVTEEGWDQGKIIPLADLQAFYNFELFNRPNNPGGDNPPQNNVPVKIQLRNHQYGSVAYRINDDKWTDLEDVDASFGLNDLKDGDTVALHAFPKEGDELDTTGTQYWVDGRNVGFSEEDLRALTTDDGFTFTYEEGHNYDVVIEFRHGGEPGGNPGGDNPPEIKNPFTMQVSVVKDCEYLIDGPVCVDNIQVNGDGEVTVEKAETHIISFIVTFPFEIETLTINKKEVEILDLGFGWFGAEVAEADSYEIALTAKESSSHTIIWANPGVEPIEGVYDESDILANGTAKVVAIYNAEDELIEDAIPKDSDGGVDEQGYGWIEAEAGDKVVFEFVPALGYQLTSVKANDEALEPQEETNRYEFIMPDTNVHFLAEFTKTEDEVRAFTGRVDEGSIALPAGTIENGSVQLFVEDAKLTEEQIKKFEEEADKEGGFAVATFLDINLHQVFYKGTDDKDNVWSNQINELKDEATITLQLADGQDGNNIVIIHDVHNDGNYEIIPVVFDPKTNTITFKTSSFSNYAIATKPIEEPESNAFMVDFDPRGGDEGEGKTPASIQVTYDGKTENVNPWEMYEYKDGSKEFAFTLTPPSDFADYAPIVELEFPNECLIFDKVTVKKSTNGCVYKFTPNTLGDVDNAVFILHVYWGEYDAIRPDYDQFLIESKVYNDSSFLFDIGEIVFDEKPISTQTSKEANETKSLFSVEQSPVLAKILPIHKGVVVSFVVVDEDIYLSDPNPKNENEHDLAELYSEEDECYCISLEGDNLNNRHYIEAHFSDHEHDYVCVNRFVSHHVMTCECGAGIAEMHTLLGDSYDNGICMVCGLTKTTQDEKKIFDGVEKNEHYEVSITLYDENHGKIGFSSKDTTKENVKNWLENKGYSLDICEIKEELTDSFDGTMSSSSEPVEEWSEDKMSVNVILKTIHYKTIETYNGTITYTAPNPHRGTFVAANEPNCMTMGNIAHYECSCGRYFSDEACENEITGSIFLAPTGHVADEVYFYDLSSHYHCCKVCDTPIVETIEAHTFVDDTCSVCGFEKSAPTTASLYCVPISDKTYTGSAITPEPTVYSDGFKLTKGKDYTLSYKNNIKPGTATVTVKGIGNFSGTTTMEFTIKAASIEENTFHASDMSVSYTGKVIVPSPFISNLNDKVLKKGTDYTITCDKEIKAIGDYTLTITGINGYNDSYTMTLHVLEAKDINKLSYSKVSAQTYTGNQICPEIVVKDKTTVLTKDVDYKVVYGENNAVGIGYIIIDALSENYYGEKIITFPITGTAISKAKITGLDTLIYNGKAQTLDNLSLVIGEKTLTIDEDYFVSYEKNTNVGNATVIITGNPDKGYSGSVKKTFKIKPYAVTENDDNMAFYFDDIVTYAKGGGFALGCIDFHVTGGSIPLVQGVDFTLSYKNHTKICDKDAVNAKGVSIAPTVTVTFKGNFTGKVSFTYSIEAPQFCELGMTCDDKVYSTKKAGWKQTTVKIYDVDGKLLKAGTDYEKNLIYSYDYEGTILVADTDTPEIGTHIYVTAVGKGNYEGSNLIGFYRIVRELIGKATVKVDKQYYTGWDVTPQLTSITIGKEKKVLVEGVDYVIISYSNNVNKGTASMTIMGIGEYGGFKTIKFNIVSSPMNITPSLFL